jgi:hypothetical protein
MTVRITHVLSGAEFAAMNEKGLAEGFWHADRHVFPPGTAWYTPWVFNPLGEDIDYVMIRERPADPNVRGYLSPHYWRDWAAKRPPICVVCPNGEQWEIDRWSSNGTGWTVSGDLPDICVSPSIVVDGYHGFLGSGGALAGQFTADIEGRGPVGIARPYTKRSA